MLSIGIVAGPSCTGRGSRSTGHAHPYNPPPLRPDASPDAFRPRTRREIPPPTKIEEASRVGLFVVIVNKNYSQG